MKMDRIPIIGIKPSLSFIKSTTHVKMSNGAQYCYFLSLDASEQFLFSYFKLYKWILMWIMDVLLKTMCYIQRYRAEWESNEEFKQYTTYDLRKHSKSKKHKVKCELIIKTYKFRLVLHVVVQRTVKKPKVSWPGLLLNILPYQTLTTLQTFIKKCLAIQSRP